MYSQIDIGVSKENDIETNEYIFNSSCYICTDLKKGHLQGVPTKLDGTPCIISQTKPKIHNLL